MIRTKPVMKRKIVMKRKAKYEIPFLKMKVYPGTRSEMRT